MIFQLMMKNIKVYKLLVTDVIEEYKKVLINQSENKEVDENKKMF